VHNLMVSRRFWSESPKAQDVCEDMSDAQGIMMEEKTSMRLGASDARQDGAAVGY